MTGKSNKASFGFTLLATGLVLLGAAVGCTKSDEGETKSQTTTTTTTATTPAQPSEASAAPAAPAAPAADAQKPADANKH